MDFSIMDEIYHRKAIKELEGWLPKVWMDGACEEDEGDKEEKAIVKASEESGLDIRGDEDFLEESLFPNNLFKIVRKSMPNLVRNSIVSEKPMESPIESIRYVKPMGSQSPMKKVEKKFEIN